MTRDDFENIYWIRRNIVRWERRLEELDASNIKSTSNLNPVPVYGTNVTSDNVSESAQKRAEIVSMIQRLTEAAKKKANEVYHYIEQINLDEPYIAAVIEERCIKCKSWIQVADVLGGSSESHRKAYCRYMEKHFQYDPNNII